MLSIGEFSSASGIPVRTLRFYHDEGLLVPAAIDPDTNYRSYNRQNLEVARVIVALRDLEFSLDEIREILAECQEDGDVLDQLARQKQSLTEKMSHYRDLVSRIDQLLLAQRRARKEEVMNATTMEIQERELAPVLVAGVRMQGRYRECGKGFALLGKRLGRHIAGMPMCLFYDGEYREEDANFEPCMPVRKQLEIEGLTVRELPSASCVSLMHRGPYEELSRTYARVIQYAKERGYSLQTPSREVYHKGPGMLFRGNPKKYLTEIQLIVTK